jgi:HAD superfamily hydrolase (TIGR01490 family)
LAILRRGLNVMETVNIVLFDMDHTLVSADTVMLWAHFLDKKGVMTAEDWRLRRKFDEDYREHRLDVAASYAFELSLLKRMSFQQREQWRAECFEEMIRPMISPVALRLIQQYKAQANTLVILITATHTFLATPVAMYAQVHEMIATEEEIHNGEYTGRVMGIPNIGEGKAKNFQNWLEKKQLVAAHTILYSDSINDLPLLLQVNRPIAVDPDSRLKAIAMQKSWEIISFKVTDKVDVAPPCCTEGSAGSIALAFS